MTSSSADIASSVAIHGPASPFAIPAEGWKQVLRRTWQQVGEDNVGLAAAGVAFYGFLAIVPLLGAIVLSYGLLAEPATVIKNIDNLATVMPADAAKLVGEQLMNVVKTSGTKKGFGLLLALALALFGARNGAGSIVIALNIAYEEKETRSFVRLNLVALAITVAAVVVAIVALVAIAALGHLEKLIPGAAGFVLILGKVCTYLMVVLGGAAGAATLYRYAPDHAMARWMWLTPGSLVAAVLWLLLTIGFGIYVANFGNYNATYGSLGAVAVTLTWLYLSSYVLLLGAELNSELEHQAKRGPDAHAEPAHDTGSAAAGHSGVTRNAVDTPATDAAKLVQPIPAEPAIFNEYGLWRAARRAGRAVGLDKVELAPSLLATGGLALLKRRERAPAGFALLAASGLIAFLSARPAQDRLDASRSPAKKRALP